MKAAEKEAARAAEAVAMDEIVEEDSTTNSNHTAGIEDESDEDDGPIVPVKASVQFEATTSSLPNRPELRRSSSFKQAPERFGGLLAYSVKAIEPHSPAKERRRCQMYLQRTSANGI